MSDPHTIHEMSNGLRVVIEEMPDVSSAAAGFLARTGSRDETREMAGASHFLEHMCFKGTEQRDWHEISVAFDEMGSIYNAFTSVDRTFYYGWVPAERIADQIELLADMVRPALPEDQFEMERKVILEEIAMAKDSLDHVAFDLLLEQVFRGHPLSWPVLGYESTVGKMTRAQLAEYHRARYSADRTVLVVAGRVDPAAVIEQAERLCGTWERSSEGNGRVPPEIRTGSASRVVDRFGQQLVAYCFEAPSARHARFEDAHAAAAILGGGNSRLYWNVVQEGISANAGAFHFELRDCGLFVVTGQTEPERVEELAEALRREADKICREPVLEHEVARIKNKRRTSMAVEGESPYHRLTQIMEDVDYRDEPLTLERKLAAVDAVTAESIGAMFEAFPIGGAGFLISVGPRDWPGAGANGGAGAKVEAS